MGWSKKYKKSINCNNPKGFSQKAHCAGKKKRNENTMKLSELKNEIMKMLQERSINAISKSQQKNADDIQKTLEVYKKVKGSGKEKTIIKLLKKLNDDKKKFAKEMDMAVSSKLKNVGYEGPLDENEKYRQLYYTNEATGYDSKTGLFYLSGVPFTRERMKEVIGMMMKGSSKPNSKQFEYENQVVVKDKVGNKKVVIDSKNLNKIIVFYRKNSAKLASDKDF